MARLPTPGSDAGQWGAILNDYLSQTLTEGGALQSETVGSSQLKNDSVTSSKLHSSIRNTLSGVQSALDTKVEAHNGARAMWVGTQAEYDALSTKNPTTLYIINES